MTTTVNQPTTLAQARQQHGTDAPKTENPVAAFSAFLDKFKPQLRLALPKHLNADRMARLALTAFSSTPDLQKCSAQSIAGSLMTAGQLGLEPGVNGHGWLIPYKGVCTFVPGWKGLVDLVSRSGRATVWTGVVRPGDEFDYQLGDEPFCRHKPGDEVEGEWTHVYAIGRVRDAQMAVIEVWTRAKVQKHLETYNKIGPRHYATKGENNFEMYGRKVALLQVLKYMPQSVEINNAAELAGMADTGRGAIIDGDFVRFVDPETGEIDPPKDDGKKPNPTGGQEPVAGAGSVGTSAAGLTQANWTPSPQEAEAIRQREIAEANAQGQQPQAAQGRRARPGAAID